MSLKSRDSTSMGGVYTRQEALGHTWSLLASNSEGQELDRFTWFPAQHGFQAWRITVKYRGLKTLVQRLCLESAAVNPPNCPSHEDVEQAIGAWEPAVDLGFLERLTGSGMLNTLL